MASDDEDVTMVPIECRACDTETEVPLGELPETLARHNEQRHDGESIARVDPDLAERIADLAASELGLLDES
jgi:hypothetical protein